MRRSLGVAGVLVFSMAAVAVACRYTVRDIGFVDLRGKEYVLVVSAAEPISDLKAVQQRLKDSNVSCVVKRTPNTTTADSQSDNAQVHVKLVRDDGQSLDLLRTDASEVENRLMTAIETQLFSNATQSLAAQTVESFAQLVLIEGADADTNSAAREIMTEATDSIRRLEPLLPRPLAHPVRSVVITSEQRADEQVLLWSLGLDPEGVAPTILTVVYGRGRLAGPVMVGDDITLRETLAQLALVGESCECETDRAWLDERILPMDWTDARREAAADELGFDPDSPLVQAEVVRIVSRGPTSNSADRGERDGQDDIEQLLLGYGEVGLEPFPDDVRPGEAESESSPTDTVKATVLTGQGWDFEPTDNKSVTSNQRSGDVAQSDAAAKTAAPEGAEQIESPRKVADNPVSADRPPGGQKSGSSPIVSAAITLVVLAGIALVAVLIVWGGTRS